MDNLLNNYKRFLASDSDLKARFGTPLIQAKISEEDAETVTPEDVIAAIVRFRAGEISLRGFLDWVNTLWFTDLYKYAEEHCESIASVMERLEALDEEGGECSEEEYDRMLDALAGNSVFVRQPAHKD
jgi:hypothetical protein